MTDLRIFGKVKNISQLCRKWRNGKRQFTSAIGFLV